MHNFFKWFQDFLGALVFSTTQASSSGHDLIVTDTSSAGQPVYAVVTPSACGELNLAFDSTTEVQNVCISMGDKLCFDIDNVQSFRARVKQGQTTIDSASTFSIGLASARNDTIESITAFLLFKLVGTNEVMISTDDNVTDLTDKATGISIGTSYVDLMIDLSNKKNVKFFVNGQPVCQSTTFDLSGYTGSLQVYIQAQKTSDNNTDSFVIDYVSVEGLRKLPSST